MAKKNKKSKGNGKMEDTVIEEGKAFEAEEEGSAETSAGTSETEEKTDGKNAGSTEADAKAEAEGAKESEDQGGNEESAEADKDPKQARIDELEDMVKRQLAEFDNFRKRTDKEKETMFEAGAKSVIEKLLPVVDNFERGLASIPEEEQGSAHAEGMQMIYKQLMGELEKLDVKPIEAVGCEFNPDLHNAVMQCESDEYESGIIAQELQKGYTYRDSVIRHSMVAVVS